MGDWRLRLTIQGRPIRCGIDGPYVVEQHQNFSKPESGDVPEFTIEVAYKTHDRNGVPVAIGYRYILKWKENGEQKQERGYGYVDKDEALRKARESADVIARTLAPVHVETYRPEF